MQFNSGWRRSARQPCIGSKSVDKIISHVTQILARADIIDVAVKDKTRGERAGWLRLVKASHDLAYMRTLDDLLGFAT